MERIYALPPAANVWRVFTASPGGLRNEKAALHSPGAAFSVGANAGIRQDLGADAAAAGASVLGGLLAVPGGEWAPAASMGLAAGGVYANGPGSGQAAAGAADGLVAGVVLR